MRGKIRKKPARPKKQPSLVTIALQCPSYTDLHPQWESLGTTFHPLVSQLLTTSSISSFPLFHKSGIFSTNASKEKWGTARTPSAPPVQFTLLLSLQAQRWPSAAGKTSGCLRRGQPQLLPPLLPKQKQLNQLGLQ